MSNNDNTSPKKSLTEALEDITEAAQEIGDNVVGPITVKAKDTARAIAKREAISAARNIHVEWLTVGRSQWLYGEQRKLNRMEAHELEFHLRRMWAITLLDNMQSYGFNWEGIRKLTGKTRQTWNNVTNSGFVPLDVLKLPTDSKRRQDAIAAQRYRPVTNAFIRKVVTEIQKANYSVHTNALLYAFTHGLTVWSNDFLDQHGTDDWVVDRLGTDGLTYFNDAKDEDVSACCALKGPDGDTVQMDMFPLLGIDDRVVNDHFAHEAVIDVELCAYGYADDKTKQPNERAKMALERWRNERAAIAGRDDFIEYEPTDPNEFRAPKAPQEKPVQPTVKIGSNSEDTTDSIIKRDDGTPPNADLGGFYIFNRPIELLPQMADDKGQIKLTVVVQMDEDGKKPKGVVTTDNKGWFHWS